MNNDANFLDAVEHAFGICFQYELELQKYREEIARLNLEVAELRLDNVRLRSSAEIPSTPSQAASTPICITPKLKKRKRKN